MLKLDKLLSELHDLYQDTYVSFSDLETFKNSHPEIAEFTKTKIAAQKSQSLLHFDFTNFKKLNQLNNFLHHREKLNAKFIKSSQRKTFPIENSTLDKHQISAVVASEDAELILAPAGSGKTATLLAKVNYLIDHDKIPPDKILVIAFTNKVVVELKDRLKNDAVEIRTFHSFGNKIIKHNFANHRLISEADSTKLIRAILSNLQKSSSDYREKYHEFLSGEDPARPLVSPNPIEPEAFEELIISAIGLQKSERLTLAALKSRIAKIQDDFDRSDAEKLFYLYAPIYETYEAKLRAKNHYDFADMLNLSTDFIKTLPAGAFAYEYILVDEAQDLSRSKSDLLKATLDKCGKVKLFAVGDDWQSIYRFAGSNLRVLDDFEKIFGRKTHRGMIELTYRFGQPTARISNRFITKNRFQSKKRVTPAIRKYTPIEFEFYDTKNAKNNHAPPDYFAVDKRLNALYKQYGGELKHKSIQIISRFNRDIFRLVDPATNRYKNTEYHPKSATFTWRIQNDELTIPFCTIHKAKGITRDIVFVINVNSGQFPATRDGNPMLETMMTALDDFPFAEERRLFYVAITRAKEKTILVADRQHISNFLLEINPKVDTD